MANREKEDDLSMRQKIVGAAIECVEKYGMHALTVRRIAKEADVNVAAINYYFGSKEKLIDEVYRQTLYTGFEGNINDFLKESSFPPRKALEMFFLHMMEGALKYPNLVKIHFYEPFMNNNYKTLSVKRLSAFFSEFEKIVCALYPDKMKKDCKMDMIQIWCAIFYPAVFPGTLREYAGSDLNDHEWQKKYINNLLDRFLGI